MWRWLITVIVWCGTLGGSALALAQPTAPQPTLEQASRRLQELLESPPEGAAAFDARRERALQQLLDELFDLDRMAREALGEHWTELSEEQRREYSGLLRQLVYRAAFQEARTGLSYTLQVGAAVSEVRRARIETIVSVERGAADARSTTILLAFLLERGALGWRVVDVDVDGVRLVRSYRLQFHRIIVGSGVAELLRRLRQRLDH